MVFLGQPPAQLQNAVGPMPSEQKGHEKSTFLWHPTAAPWFGAFGKPQGAAYFSGLRPVVAVMSADCREMRKWDEDGQPEAEAVEFGEFVIKVKSVGVGGGWHASMQSHKSCAMNLL